MKTLIFDTETTGFPHNNVDLHHEVQPHLIQLATIIAEGSQVIDKWQTIIACPIEVPEGAYKVHGIDKLRSQHEGVTLVEALRLFEGKLSEVDRAVCHNTWFDFYIMRIAYARASFNAGKLNSIPTVCTMKTATGIVSSRWPKLDAAYKMLVDEEGFSNAHSADADALACYEVLLALEERNAVLRN